MGETQYAGLVNLRQVLHHLDTGWARRGSSNVVMCHYADYSADLPDEILRLAAALDINLTKSRADELAAEATLDRMRDRAVGVIPNAGAFWKDDSAFLRAFGLEEWRARVNDDDLVEYNAIATALASPDLVTWAHKGRIAPGVDPAAS